MWGVVGCLGYLGFLGYLGYFNLGEGHVPVQLVPVDTLQMRVKGV